MLVRVTLAAMGPSMYNAPPLPALQMSHTQTWQQDTAALLSKDTQSSTRRIDEFMSSLLRLNDQQHACTDHQQLEMVQSTS